jgi:hypothetical protein
MLQACGVDQVEGVCVGGGGGQLLCVRLCKSVSVFLRNDAKLTALAVHVFI